MVDFVAFQDISSRDCSGCSRRSWIPDAETAAAAEEGRAALQRRLWQQPGGAREARPGRWAWLLQALRAARLPGLERSIREHFLPAQ